MTKQYSSTATQSFVEVLQDKRLLGRFIDDPATFKAWFCLWRAFYALPPEPGDLELFKQCTGRSVWPTKACSEGWFPIGIRGGKSLNISILCCWLSCFVKHDLTKGELGHILIVSPTRKQSRIIRNYVGSMLNDHPVLRRLIEHETQEEILLTNGVAITIISSDYKSLRGFTAIACIIDEIGYLGVEGAKPDIEVVRALRGRLASTNGPLFAIGSPYARRGELWNVHKRHYGQDNSEIMVFQASSRTMNPTLSQKVLDRAMKEDEAAARADFLAEFRSDIETFVSQEVVESCVVTDRYELPPISGVSYRAFTDPAGGSGQDAMTLAISHAEGDLQVLDAIREIRPPFSPESAVAEFATLLKRYNIRTVTGDRYAGQWPADRFSTFDIDYQSSELNKSQLYQAFLPILNSGECQLLGHDRLIKQLCNLERRTARGGRDSIDHPPGQGQHDDVCNAVAGALAHPNKLREAGVWGAGRSTSLYRKLDPRLFKQRQPIVITDAFGSKYEV